MAVTSEAPEVLAGLERLFAEMLVPTARSMAGELEVDRAAGQYRVRGNATVDLEDGSLADVLRCLRFSVIQILIQARPDLLWLHAGATALGGRAVLLPGPRGHGKSTLVAGLNARGWAYLSDDIVPLDLESGAIIPFPQSPAIREYPGEQMPDEWLRLPSKVDVALAAVCREPVNASAVVFPAYRPGTAAELVHCPPATAAVELLQHCWNFSDHGEGAVRYLCGLVQRLPTFRLSFSDGGAAAEQVARRLAGWRRT